MKIFDFDMDSSLYKFGALVFDLMIINFLAILLTAIGFGFTFGLAFTATTYTIYEGIRKDQGRLVYHFIKSLKDSYRQALPLSIAITVLAVLTNWFITSVASYEIFPSGFLVIQYLLLFQLSILSIFLFPLISKVNMRTSEAIKYSFLMAYRHLPTSVSCLCLVIFTYYAIKWISPVFIVVSFSGIAYIIERLVFERLIIEKYLSEDLKRKLKIS